MNMNDQQRELFRVLNASRIPDYMHHGLVAYVTEGRPAGDFLMSVLENDLKKACNHADEVNQHVIWDYSFFLFNHAPSICYGSPKLVKAWIDSHNEKRKLAQESHVTYPDGAAIGRRPRQDEK